MVAKMFDRTPGTLRAARRLGVLLALLAVGTAGPHAQVVADESDPTLVASALLDATAMKGPHHTVGEAVRTPGPYHLFIVTSSFGAFEAAGKSQVAVRLQEIDALAALEDVNKAGVVARAAGESLVKVGTGVVNAVTDPVETAKGIGSGVKRLGINIGRRARRAVDRVTADDKKEGDEGGGAGATAADLGKRIIGINSARRRWAQRVGADPYTTNPVLREALEGVAAADVAGRIATSIVVPIPPLVGTTAKVGDLVWGRDPEELRKLNEQRAREMGTPDDGAKAFFRNRNFTLTMQTRIIAALRTVNVPGVGDYVVTAAEAEDDRDALFFVESAEMLQAQHEASATASVLADSRAIVVKRADGTATALLPLDWLRDSASTRAQFAELAERSRRELGATSLRLVVAGTVTPAAAAALETAGWRR
jgi:hypothetical protein